MEELAVLNGRKLSNGETRWTESSQERNEQNPSQHRVELHYGVLNVEF
jgi:hypothetical protein